MRKKAKLVLCVIVALSFGIFWIMAQKTKQVITLSDLEFERYTLEDAAEKASVVVYGKVLEKGETTTALSIDLAKSGTSASGYFTSVTIEVIDMVKKNNMYGLDLAGEQFTYMEYGGEQDGVIYQYGGMDEVEIGKEYVFFLNSGNKCLSSQAVVPVIKGEVSFEGYLSTDCFYSEEMKGVEKVPVQLYIQMVRDISLRAQQTVDGIYNLYTLVSCFDMDIYYGEITKIKENKNADGEVQAEWEVCVEESFKGNYTVGEYVTLQDSGNFSWYGGAEKGDKYFFFWMKDERLLAPAIYQADGLVYCEFDAEKKAFKSFLYTMDEFGEVLRAAYKGE